MKQYFVAPEPLQIGADILQKLDAAKVNYEVTADFARVMPEVDAIYMTRIQDEWDQAGESKAIDISRFQLRAEHLQVLRPEAIIMHPLPRRNEIAPEIDADPPAKYWRQVRNGMWVRAVLILMIFDREKEIDRYYNFDELGKVLTKPPSPQRTVSTTLRALSSLRENAEQLMKHLITLENWSSTAILDILDLADRIKARPSDYREAMHRKP